MNRRYLSLALAVVLAFSLFPLTAMAASVPDAQRYIKTIDANSRAQSYLFDFDRDGREELLIIHSQKSSGFDGYEVWSGGTLLARKTDSEYTQTGGIDICSRDGKYYVHDFQGGFFQENGSYSTVENGKWVTKDTYESKRSSDTGMEYKVIYARWNGVDVDEDTQIKYQSTYKIEEGVVFWKQHSVRDELMRTVTTTRGSLTPAKAIELFEQYTGTLSPVRSLEGDILTGWFYLDFDQNGIPELVVERHSSVREDGYVSRSLWACYIDSESGILSVQDCAGYPDTAAKSGQSSSSFYVDAGGMTARNYGYVVLYANGTYGLKEHYDGFQSTEDYSDTYPCVTDAFVRYNGMGDFVLTEDQGSVSIYAMDGSPFPSKFAFYSLPNTAYAATQKVLVDGKPVELQAYALKDEKGNLTNYVKVRDVADLLDGTAAQFNVGWAGAVNIETGKPYTTRNGQENQTPYSNDRLYTLPTARTLVNGAAAALDAFVLTDDEGNGSTYYKLRDLGKALGFNVSWSLEKGVYIESDQPYKG